MMEIQGDQLNSMVQDWPKRLCWVNFFSYKSDWIFACAFQLSSKTFPCIFWLVCTLFLRKTRTKYRSMHSECNKVQQEENFLCGLAVVVFFLKKDQVKKMQGNVLLLNWNAHARIQAFLKGKKFTQKSHLHQSCTKSFILVPTTTQLRRHSWLQQCWGCLLTENVSETPVEF